MKSLWVLDKRSTVTSQSNILMMMSLCYFVKRPWHVMSSIIYVSNRINTVSRQTLWYLQISHLVQRIDIISHRDETDVSWLSSFSHRQNTAPAHTCRCPNKWSGSASGSTQLTCSGTVQPSPAGEQNHRISLLTCCLPTDAASRFSD